MKLTRLFKNLSAIKITGDLSSDSTGLCQDSRIFKKGDVFVAIRGARQDGHLFVRQACDKGATAVVVEDEHVVPSTYTGVIAKVKNTREALDYLASAYYNFPSEKLFVAAVTGTNGKTTVTHMIEAVLNPSLPTAVMGTIDYHFQNKVLPSTHTTPDAMATQKLFQDWLTDGARAVSMEVSSHALTQSRIDSIQFDAAVYTNITRDHLDFHQTMEDYTRAKSKLFFDLMDKSNKKLKRNILNKDDELSQQMHNKKIPTWFYGMDLGDIKIKNVKLNMDFSKFDVEFQNQTQEFEISMIGLHNVYNAAAATGVGLHAGLDLKEISENLKNLKTVKGRLHRVASKSPIRVFVDYAHTDDALINVLGFLKKLKDELSPKNKIITVFGCGGDRDKGKRPLMFKAALRFSDMVVVTSDNPRTEDPEAIIKDIVGIAPQTKVGAVEIFMEVDRRKAIELAVKKSDPGDVVLIAGKGHEDYQIIGTQKFPFDDYEVAKKILDAP